jgi:predicted TIM-barrel fold metal-dependent hydrolase
MENNGRMDRRRFLAALTAVPLALHGAESAEGILDTHTHFYDPTRPQGVPWPPRQEPRLYRRVLPPDYLALKQPQPVRGTVVVEASPWVEDNQWILDLAREHPFIRGLVGNLPIGTPEFAGHLRKLAENPRFCGVRIRDRKLDEAGFLPDLERLAAANLSLDLVGGREVLAFAGRISARVPRLRVVIDHLAGVRVDGQAPAEDWCASMRALATQPQVYFKVSGLVEGTGRRAGDAPAEPAYYRPVLDFLWQTFGAGRLIYGSNWPVSELYAPLATVQRIAWNYFSSRGAEAQVFWRNAQKVYLR